MNLSFKFESLEELTSQLNHRSLKELRGWAQNGWTPGLDAINNLLDEVSLHIEFKQDIAPAVEGLFFDIGLVCSDIPEHWFSPQPISKGAFNNSEPIENLTPIKIGVNLGNLFTNPFGTERGAAVVVLMMYLIEKFKRPVILKQFYKIETLQNSFTGSVILKKEDEPLNIEALSFWVCCPQVVDCWTRVMEDTPCLQALTQLTVKQIPVPVTQYGKDEVDVFISVDDDKTTWTREDSKTWISSTLQTVTKDSQNSN